MLNPGLIQSVLGIAGYVKFKKINYTINTNTTLNASLIPNIIIGPSNLWVDTFDLNFYLESNLDIFGYGNILYF